MRGRLIAAVLALAVLPLGPLAGANGVVGLDCDGAAVDPSGTQLYDDECNTTSIRPGIASRGCTLNWVMTNGTTYFIATAGHCGGVGKRWNAPGVGWFGTTVFREFNGVTALEAVGTMRDWALIEVDADKAHLVDGTMVRFGGPHTPLLDTRPPVPGEAVVHYGHGLGLGKTEPTKARASAGIVPVGNVIVYAGTVGPGDSGSPVRFATGEPAGIVVAVAGLERTDSGDPVVNDCAGVAPELCSAYDGLCFQVDDACDAPHNAGGIHGIVVATRFDVAMEAFEAYLGDDLEIVDGRPALLGGP